MKARCSAGAGRPAGLAPPAKVAHGSGAGCQDYLAVNVAVYQGIDRYCVYQMATYAEGMEAALSKDIRVEIVERGITQKTLAESMGIGPQL
jgi:hypothetical protein